MEAYTGGMATPRMSIAAGVDKLSYEIFSLLESKFLFGGDCLSDHGTPARDPARVRVLSIDGCSAGAEDALLAATALARLEAGLRKQTGDGDARVADFFDVAAGAGAGGVLAAMLFMKGEDGRPRYSAEEALAFVAASVEKKWSCRRRGRWAKMFRGTRSGNRSLQRVFGEATLKDTVAPLLVPCYDLATAAPFMFSRADAVETDTFDFRLCDVCAATCAVDGAPASVRSIDGRTSIYAASAGMAAMGNPTAAAITHVLHNKKEFPLATGVEDLLVVSIGAGASSSSATLSLPSPRELAPVTAQGVADMVDESVAMAFGYACGTNYVRIQARKAATAINLADTATAAAREMLAQRNVESVLFRGRRMSEQTNAEKVGALVPDLVKEQERRRHSPLPNVAIKHVATTLSPRLSSVTTSSSSITTPRTESTMASPLSCHLRR